VAVCCAALIALPFFRAHLEVPEYAYLIVILLLGYIGVFRVITTNDFRVRKELVAFCFGLVLFSAWMGFSCIWSVSRNQYITDMQRLMLFSLLVISLICACSRRTPRLVITYIIIFSLIASSVVIWAYVKLGDLRGYHLLFHQSYLVFATLIGLGVVVSFLNMLSQDKGKRLNGPVGLVLLSGLGLSLARGALISAMLVIILFSTYIVSKRYGSVWKRLLKMRLHKKQLTVILGAVVFCIVAVAVALNVERTHSRLYRLFSGAELREGGRIAWWANSIENIARSPFIGHGLGSNGIMAGVGEDGYPHNLLLQVALDGGIIGVFLLIGWLALPFKAFLRKGKGNFSAEWPVILGGYTFVILEYMKSSNFYTARSLVVLGVCALLSAFGGPSSAVSGLRPQQREKSKLTVVTH